MIKLKISLILTSLLLFTLVWAKKPSEHTHIYKNLDYLELTLAQHERMKQILLEYKKKFDHYYEKRKKEEKKLQKLMQKEHFDKEEYEEIAEEIYEDSIELEAKTLKKIHGVLTPKQRELFSHYLKEWQVE